MINLLMKIQTMELNYIKAIWETITYKLSILRVFSLFLVSLILIGCEKTKIESIKIDDDLMLMPGPKDSRGCTQFVLKSKLGNPTIQIIYFVDKNGNYSANQDEIKNCI